MKCPCCSKEVVYAGPPWVHVAGSVDVQNAEKPHDYHGSVKLPKLQLVIPMYDGGLILTVDVCMN